MIFRNFILGLVLALSLNSCVPSIGIGIPIGRHGSIGIDSNGDVGVGIGVGGVGVGFPL